MYMYTCTVYKGNMHNIPHIQIHKIIQYYVRIRVCMNSFTGHDHWETVTSLFPGFTAVKTSLGFKLNTYLVIN